QLVLRCYVTQLREATENRTESDARTPAISAISFSPLRLPKIELRSFDGNSTNWHVFWDWCVSTVDNQAISDQKKFAYFPSCMVGTDKELIEAYHPQNPAYSDIVKRVKERYANNEIIIQQRYAQLERIARIQDGRQVCRLVEDIERILELFSHQGFSLISDPMIQRQTEKKLPRWVLQDLERKNLEDDSWDVTKLRKFLSNVALTQEAVHRMTSEVGGIKISERPHFKGSKPSVYGKNTSALSVVPERKTKAVPCAFCKAPHFANQCRKYPVRDQRVQRCRLLSLCFRCLKPSHCTKECLSQKICFYCKGFHNGAFCLSRRNQQRSGQHSRSQVTQMGTADGENIIEEALLTLLLW
uniref:Gag-like protein n=1 Tax=Parascaris univalens TaxID=6257 RepID=A0A914ZXC2_PARUN